MSFSAHSTDSAPDRQSNGSTQPRQKFACLQCPKSFSRSENLKRHVASHEAGKYRCVTCGKQFTRSDLLKRHRKNHERGSSFSEGSRAGQLQQPLPEFKSGPDVFMPMPSGLEITDGRVHSVAASQPENTFDNFMSSEGMSGLDLGSFDGDIAWTLDFAYSHPFGVDFPGNSLTPSSVDYTILEAEEFVSGPAQETGEWPDRISRPTSPKGQRPVNSIRHPPDWPAVISEAQLARTQHLPPYVAALKLDLGLRQALINFLNQSSSTHKDTALQIDHFPPVEILDHFLVLFFRHVHERFPVIHLPTFNLSSTTPLLLLAMLLVGSSHSKSTRGWFVKVFYKHCRLALTRNVESNNRFLRYVDNIYGLLLVCVSGTWSGDRESYEFAEGFRGVLITTSRRCRLLDCRTNPGVNESHKNLRILDQMWHSWIEHEKRKRLGLAIYFYDCQYPALFNNQPYVSKAETANSVLPCPQEYWDAKTSDAWKMLIGPANMPPSTFYIHALNSCLLEPEIPTPQRADDFGRTLVLYALHTHIFEWRQAISMLNPNGFANMYGAIILDIGDGLRVRKEWLIGSLENWHKCYYNLCLNPTIVLMYHLGFVSLDVSLSDLHLAAGRSGNRAEGDIAEQSLRTWANSEGSATTMFHVRKGFEVAYSVLDSGAVLTGSFEMIMTLFTGGLVTWAYLKFRQGDTRDISVDQIRRAAFALRGLVSWRISSLFGTILKDFEDVSS